MFIPKKSATEVEKYKKLFLRGCAFRVDAGHDFMDVIERSDINKGDAKYGVGRGDFRRVEKFYDRLPALIKALKKKNYTFVPLPTMLQGKIGTVLLM